MIDSEVHLTHWSIVACISRELADKRLMMQ
jgi:hypothetical protein